jgi:hypothetical protein
VGHEPDAAAPPPSGWHRIQDPALRAARARTNPMYIGIGTVVLIVIIVLVILMLRRR